MKTHQFVLFSLLIASSAASACDRCGQACDSQSCPTVCDDRGILDNTADLFGKLKSKATPHMSRTKHNLLSLLKSKSGDCDAAPECGCEMKPAACGCEATAPACGCEVAPSCGCETQACSTGGCRQPAWDTAPGASCEPLLNRIFKLKKTSCSGHTHCDHTPAPSCGCETAAPACGCEMNTVGCGCGHGATIGSHAGPPMEYWEAPPVMIEQAVPAPEPPRAVPTIEPQAERYLPDSQVNPFEDDVQRVRSIPGKAIQYQSQPQPQPKYDDAYDHQASHGLLHIRLQDGFEARSAEDMSSRSRARIGAHYPADRVEVVPASGTRPRPVPRQLPAGYDEPIVNPLRR